MRPWAKECGWHRRWKRPENRFSLRVALLILSFQTFETHVRPVTTKASPCRAHTTSRAWFDGLHVCHLIASLEKPWKVGVIIASAILQLRKLRPRESTELAQGHRAGKGGAWVSTLLDHQPVPILCADNGHFLNFMESAVQTWCQWGWPQVMLSLPGTGAMSWSNY